MSVLFTLLFLLSHVALVAGLIRPNWVLPWDKTKTRGRVGLAYGVSTIVFLVLAVLTTPEPVTQAKTASPSAPSVPGDPTAPSPSQTPPSPTSVKPESSSTTDKSISKTKAEYSSPRPELSNQQVQDIAFTTDCDDRVMNTSSYTNLKGQLVPQFEEEDWPRDLVKSGGPMSDVVHAAELFNQGRSEDEVLAEMEKWVQTTTADIYSVPDYYPAFVTGAAKDIYLPKYLELVKKECRDLDKS